MDYDLGGQSTMGKFLGCILPTLVAGLLLYLLIVYAPGALLYVGIAVYIVVAILYYGVAHRQGAIVMQARGETERLIQNAEAERKRRTPWGRTEAVLHSVARHLHQLSTALIWLFAVPLGAFVFLLFWRDVDTSSRVGALRASTFPAEIMAALCGLLATATVFALVYLGAGPRLILFLCTLALLSIFVRLIAFAIGPISLPKALRLKSDYPYLIFIFLALLDGAALVFNLHVFRATTTQGVNALSLNDFLATATAVFDTPSFIKMVLPPRPMEWHSLIMGVAGVVFFAAVLNNLVRLKAFRRTDEDYVILASIENQIGAFSKALRLLQEIKGNSDAKFFATRATALGGLRQFPLALGEVKASLDLDPAMKHAQIPSFPMFTLGGMIVHSGADEPTRVEFVEFAEKSGLTSRDLAYLLDVVLSTTGGDSKAIATQLLARGSLDKHLPAKAMALFCADKRQEALETLSAGSYNHPVDELYRKQSLLMIALADPDTSAAEDAQTFGQWISDNLPDIENIVQSTTEQADAFPLIGILRISVSLARDFAHPDLERLRYMRDLLHGKLRAAFPGSSEIASVLGVIEREDTTGS